VNTQFEQYLRVTPTVLSAIKNYQKSDKNPISKQMCKDSIGNQNQN
jgi:hypothetical protein